MSKLADSQEVSAAALELELAKNVARKHSH